ncbi:MAG TPA: hypothetical protein VFG01_01625 [Acidobacteriota bacterium]|nr:hypothetical protein [Acidobacteriota bacterium]
MVLILGLSLSISIQLPMFCITAWVKFMPPLCRAPHSQYAGFPLCSSRLAYHLYGFDAENKQIFDTSSSGSLPFISFTHT